MKKTLFAMKSWKQGIAALGALAALALAPAPAHAEICGDFDDIADDLLDFYLEEFDVFFGLSEKTCDEMVKTFTATCTTKVKDAAKCWDGLFKSLPKAAKPPCNESAQNPSSCYNSYKEEARGLQNLIGDDVHAANNDCNVAADTFFDACRDLIP